MPHIRGRDNSDSVEFHQGVVERIAVIRDMLLVKGVDHLGFVVQAESVFRHRYAQFKALAVISDFSDHLEGLIRFVDLVAVEKLLAHGLQFIGGGANFVDRLLIGCEQVGDDRTRMFVLQIGAQQSHCRRNPRRQRHQNVARRREFRQCRTMERTRAAERHQREIARIIAARHGVRADRQRHVVVDDPDDAQRGLGDGNAQRAGDMLLDRLVRQFRVQRQVAAQELVCVHPPQNHLGVGHGRFGAAAVVAGRARFRPGRARPDIETAGHVKIGNRSAACADGFKVDHRRHDRMPGHDCVARVLDAELAVGNGRDIGRGPADIHGKNVLSARQPRLGQGADHTPGWARHQYSDWLLGTAFYGRDAAVRLDHPQLGRNARSFHLGLKVAQIH